MSPLPPPPRPPEAEAAPAAPRLADSGLAARLLEGLAGLDLTSADGRAGIGALLAEIERLSPGAILQQAARIELRRVGWRRDALRPDDGGPSAGPRPAAPSASMGLPSRPAGPTVGAPHQEGEIA